LFKPDCTPEVYPVLANKVIEKYSVKLKQALKSAFNKMMKNVVTQWTFQTVALHCVPIAFFHQNVNF